ncbi:threonine/serine exporter family protein [Agromyces atrinae]|uniref:Threonine/serine exporter family protein n=1 Tax=Agromyces atrinae TaxID=592376 RepID=A0A4Q2M6Z9_9MICO|nr:threonine/serine exporter family protein [Agromyces atrinae]MCI2956489.1 threonine/serine exporter family protein [Agromyces atrinae]NYD68137.1 uncharacterized membrane protein YjjP (DUF1212 family) [Agromyces atrinae]RXZ87718.1 threonine/serine exporter family protein [Agromyces atrinae]
MASTATETIEPAVLRRFLLGLAEGMTASDESVDEIHRVLLAAAHAYGDDEMDVVVLPTVILLQSGGRSTGQVSLRSRSHRAFRFDQIAALYRLVHDAEQGAVDPADGIRRLNEIGSMSPRFGWVVRTLGHAILTAGLSLLLVPSWQGLAIAFVLGLIIGFAKLVRSPTLQLVFPVFASFFCALVVFVLADRFGIGDPLHVLIAPLATFLPGGVLTTATVELAAGQMIAGASRLVMGLVQLGLLAFGILAAAQIVGVDAAVSASSGAPLPWWVAIVGLVLFAIGNYLHFSAPAATFGWVLLTIGVAYSAQLVGGLIAGAEVSGFIGALAMTPVVHAIAALPKGAPTQITFLPAFWVLVPGAAGLVGLTEAVGSNAGLTDFVSALTTVMSIALGVLIGTALYRFARQGAAEIADFHIELPHAASEAPPSTWWGRMTRGLRVPRLRRR